jgi:DNA processing protein
VGEETAKNIKNKVKWKVVDEQLKLLEKYSRQSDDKIEFITYKDPDYPENLKTIYDPPPFLFVKGKLKKEDKKSLAIVGTRRASAYGKGVAEKLASELIQRGVTIVSGLARGIDSIGHISALREKGRTLAIFGSGLDVIYPREHTPLVQRIIRNGAILSDFFLGTKPLAENFPKRNRLISGLSLGVIVIEAPRRSGALLTAECALDQGREVFAVPGNIGSKKSEGTNALIKKGAALVTSVDDILNELKGILTLPSDREKIKLEVDLSEEEKKIFSFLSSEPNHIDKIAKQGNFRIPHLLSVLLSLELKGLVKQLSGKMFVRTL